MDLNSRWKRARAVVLAVSASLGAIGAFMPTTAARQTATPQTRVDAQERTRLATQLAFDDGAVIHRLRS